MTGAGKSRLGSGGGARGVERLPAAMQVRVWKPGQSGNPKGFSGEYGQAVKLAKRASARAITRLIELMESEDERVAAVACNSILDRAFGKPAPVKEQQRDTMEQRIANMTREQRLERMRELLGPMRQYLSELDDEETVAEAESTPIAREVVEPGSSFHDGSPSSPPRSESSWARAQDGQHELAMPSPLTSPPRSRSHSETRRR
jgi:hypothetical protein